MYGIKYMQDHDKYVLSHWVALPDGSLRRFDTLLDAHKFATAMNAAMFDNEIDGGWYDAEELPEDI